MPALDVSLASDALLLLGAGTIAAFDEGTDKALVAGNLYPGVRDALIAKHPWRFTMKKAKLARETAIPVAEWRWQFAWPADCLVLRQLFDAAAINAPPLREFELFERKVLANASELWADYQHRPNEAQFPPYFAQLLRYALAAEFAHSIVESDSKAQYWNVKAFGAPGEGGMGGEFMLARRLDSQQQPAQAIDDYSLTAARFG
jgi:hypothetical protein